MLQFSPDIFNPANFVKAGILNKMLVAPVADVNDIGVVTYSQCADTEGKFTLDTASSSYSPNPLKKNQNVVFDMDGIVSAPMYVGNIHLHVNW